MTPENFVAALIETVHDASVLDTLATLESGPSGRRPPPRLAQLSAWYQGLSSKDQTQLRQVVELAVHATLFGTLCVLDGVRTIEPTTDLQLFAAKGSHREQLNPPNGECLHDEYQTHVYARVFGSEA